MSDELARKWDMATFGPKLRAAISRKHTSVPKLADYLASQGIEGASKSAIYDWQDDRYSPNVVVAAVIARHLDVSLDYLTNDELDAPAAPELSEDDAYVLKVFRDSELPASVAARALMRAAANVTTPKTPGPMGWTNEQATTSAGLQEDIKPPLPMRRTKRGEIEKPTG